MTYPATTYAEGVELTITSGNQLHEIINGDATEEINTESGMVPSVRKALADSMLFKPAIAWAEGSVESDPFQTRLYGEGIYWAPAASNETPISMGTNPNIDTNWFLAPVTGFDSIASNTNLLSNHNFIIKSPDDITHPNVTPTDYVAGTQIFSGVFVGDDIVGLTYIDGRVSWAAGTLYFSVPNSGALEYVDQTEFVASVADFDGKPRTRGVSFALVGDEYRVTVGVDALEDESANETLLGSVKFEQGSVATGHEVGSISAGNLSDYTDIVYKASGGNSAIDNMVAGIPLPVKSGGMYGTGSTLWRAKQDGVILGAELKDTLRNSFDLMSKAYVDDWGAVRNSAPDATQTTAAINECAKFCFEGYTQENAVPQMTFIGQGGYITNGPININYNHLNIGADGWARIQPEDRSVAFNMLDNLDAVTEKCRIDGLIFYMYGDFDAANESFGNATAMRFERLSRNAYINVYCIGGDTGLDLATSEDHWGINLGPECRFESQKYPMRLDVNGQTFNVNGGLFNSTVKSGVDVTIIGNSSQINFNGTVFENDGVNNPSAGGKMLRVSGNVKELLFSSCQSERIGYYADRTGIQADYDVVITGAERITLMNSRMWGGNYGSTAPGNSRNFGWWLENCSLKLISSRLWSFSEKAIHCVGDVSISCDSRSQVDGRIDGDFKVVSNADLGKNQISSPDGSRYELSRGQPVPLGWRHLNATTTPQSALVSSGLSEQSTKNGFTFTGSAVYTNQIKVTKGDEICIRFFGEFAGSTCDLFSYQFNPDGTIDLNNSSDPESTLIKSFTLNSTGAENGRAYFVLRCVIDQDVELVSFRFNRKTTGDETNYIESPSVYVNSGIDWEESSAYSDNDSTFGFRFYLGPLLPALPNGDLIAATQDIKGVYRQGELISHQWTASTEPLISTFNNTGDIDGSAISLVTVATKP